MICRQQLFRYNIIGRTSKHVVEEISGRAQNPIQENEGYGKEYFGNRWGRLYR